MNAADQQRIRLARLRQIAEEHTEEAYDREVRDELAGVEPVAPFAVVTSEGSAESSFLTLTCTVQIGEVDSDG